MGDAALQEAAAYVAKAEKALKGGFFKKPDKDTALQEYTKAANAYKKGRAFGQAKDAFIKVAELQAGADSAFHGAKNYENAALMAKDCKQMEEAAQLFSKASVMYREGGFADSAAQMLEKAAKIFEDADWQKAVELYCDGGDVMKDDAKYGPAGLCFKRAAALCCREQKWERGLEMLGQEAECHKESGQYDNLFRVWLSMIVLHIKNGDMVGADQVWANNQEYPGWTSSEEGRLGNALLNAYDEGDQDQVDEILKKQKFKYLDNEVAKVAKTITVPGGGKKKKAPADTPPAPAPAQAGSSSEQPASELGADEEDDASAAPAPPAPKPATPQPEEEEEEEEEDSLC